MGLVLFAFPLIAGGCGSIFESNQGACRRVLSHFERCAREAGASDAGGTFFGVSVTQLCEGVSETDDRNYSAIADCLTSFTCAQLSGEVPVTDFGLQLRCLAAISSG